MITEFDKSGIAAHYKNRFAECLDDCDFEGALNFLLKYREEKNNPDFHLACGMLYLQMCLDSDDNELVCMAYRELMMHIRRFPDCAKAYRDMLAALLLKREGHAFLESCKWLKARGIDFRAVMGELAESGVLFTAQDDEPPDFDGLFAGEYGEIDPDGEYEPVPEKKSTPSKIITFGGAAKPEKPRTDADEKPVQPVSDRFTASHEADDESEGEFGDFINAYIYGEEYDAEDADRILEGISDSGYTEIDSGADDRADAEKLTESADLIRDAEDAYDAGDHAAAISVLSRIKRGDEQYYFALNMRALIDMEYERFDSAEAALNEAAELRPDGALVGSLLCQLYEYKKEYDRIPQTLKRIDVRDYINCAHLYKSFDMVLKYCNAEDAEELIKSYIDEFNIMELRLVYAQLLYNRGEREIATDELYNISRIFYDDVNARYFYLLARSGIDKFDISVEAPQNVLGALVENFMGMALTKGLPDELLEHEVFVYGMEFFLTLEYRNDKRLLREMFKVLRALADDARLTERIKDALVSPYVEPIVKAVLLGELIAASPTDEFLACFSYVPFSSDCERRLDAGYSSGYYTAYAFVAAMCRSRIGDLVTAAERVTFADGVDERDKAYYLFDLACTGDGVLGDERIPLAFGYTSKTAAAKALKAVRSKITMTAGAI